MSLEPDTKRLRAEEQCSLSLTSNIVLTTTVASLKSKVLLLTQERSSEHSFLVLLEKSPKLPPSMAFNDVVASLQTLDSSFLIVGDAGDVIIGCTPAIPIIVGDGSQDALRWISELGTKSPYLSNVLSGNEDERPLLVESALPVAILFTCRNEKLFRITQKIKVNAGIIHSMTLCTPVHEPAHLIRELLHTPSPVNGDAAFTLLYCGASWCPPCMRILTDLPSMVCRREQGVRGEAAFSASLREEPNHDFPKSILKCLKVDYDTSFQILEILNITTIPTFVVLDNVKFRTSCRSNQGVELASLAENVDEHVVSDIIRSSVVGAIQSSSKQTVLTFLEKTCGVSLTFDDDF